MIPDGIHETPAADNAEAVPVTEEAAQGGTVTTDMAECNEDEVQLSANHEMSEPSREETTEEEMCLTNSEVPLPSEVSGSYNDEHDRNADDAGSSEQITDGEMKPLSQDAEQEKECKDDRQPNVVEDKTECDDSQAATANEDGTCPEDVTCAETSTENHTGVTAEEEEESYFGHRKYYLLDTDTSDHSEQMDKCEMEQKQSVMQDELNSREQLLQQTTEHIDEASGGEMSEEEAAKDGAEDNENALEESTDREVEAVENMVELSELENKYSEREAAENDEESIRNEETEQLPENMPEQTTEHLQSVEETTGEHGTQAESQSERNALTPEGDESMQYMTNGQSELMSDQTNENIHSGTLDQYDTKETEETAADSTDACDRRLLESAEAENQSDKSAVAAAATTEEQVSQSPETRDEKGEDRVVDSVQPDDSQPSGTSESVEQIDKVGIQETNCEQAVQDDTTHADETADKQPGKTNNEDILTEQQTEVTNTEQHELEVADIENKPVSLSENSEDSKTESMDESERVHQDQSHEPEKEDITIDMLIADGANETCESTERTTDKVDEESDAKEDKSVEATNTNHSFHTDEADSGEHYENALDYSYDEPDKAAQEEQSHSTSETTQDKPPPGVDKVCANEDSCNALEVQKDGTGGDEDVKGQASEISETSEMMPERDNATEVGQECVTNATMNEESTEEQHPIEILGEEDTEISEIVENAESNNAAENEEQIEQNELATDTVTSNPDELNEANELIANISEEEFRTPDDQPCENSSTTEKIENQSESESAVDKSSAESNETCEVEKAIESTETTEAVNDELRATAAESQAEQPTYMPETAREQLETEVVEGNSRSGEEATENPEGNDENVPDAEYREHHETEFSETAESEEQPSVISENAEDDAAPAAAVELHDRNNAETEVEHETELEIIAQPTEAVAVLEYTATESETQFNESCALAAQDDQSTETSDAADSMRAIHADDREENESPVGDIVERTEEQSTNTEVTASGASDDIDCDTGSGTVTLQTETTQLVEVTAACSRTFETSDDVMSTAVGFEATETLEVSQEDAVVFGQPEEIANCQTEDDQEPTRSINGHDTQVSFSDSAEKHESIRSYVDGCRDVELSGMKLATDQVGHNASCAF